jgi:hypothetical protein
MILSTFSMFFSPSRSTTLGELQRLDGQTEGVDGIEEGAKRVGTGYYIGICIEM